MGTSKDVRGPRSREWSRVRRRATDFAKQGGGAEATTRLVEGFVAAMGGASGLLAASSPAIRAGQGLAGFGADVAQRGFTPALEELGLVELVGQPRLEVISALADAFAGDGSTLEDVAARKAVVEVLNEILPEGDDVTDLELDAAGVAEILSLQLAYWIYFLQDTWIADRIAKRAEPAEKGRLDREIRSFIVNSVRLELEGLDVLAIQWRTNEGRAEFERIAAQVFRDLEEALA